MSVCFDMGRIAAQYKTTDTLSVSRRPAGSYAGDGYYSKASPQALAIKAHVQPASAKDLEVVPEGQRTRKTIAIYPLLLADKMQAANPEGVQADLVTYKSETYEVQHVWDWTDSGNYTKAVATLVDEP